MGDSITVDRFADRAEAAVKRISIILIVAVGRIKGYQKTCCCEEQSGQPVAEEEDRVFGIMHNQKRIFFQLSVFLAT
ncbi:MAG: hypothetical protein D3907_01810 [Candidatus Electrothrix sp. AUS3]|nr:hypothetical protein [Candidatus Electrothrix gigas]